MAQVLLRYWAAARAAAGRPEEHAEGTLLADVLAGAAQRHGPEFARVLERCSFLVDEVRGRPETPLADGSVVEVLPPFAGGSEAAAAHVPSTEGAGVALVPVVLAALAWAAVGLGSAALAVAVGALQALFLWRALPVLGFPGRGQAAVLAVAATVPVDVLLAVRDTDPVVAPVAWILGPAVTVAIIAQLVRRDGRVDLVASLMGTLALLVVLAAGALYLPVLDLPDGGVLAGVGLAAAALATAVQWLVRPPVAAVVAGLVPGAALGLVAGAAGDADLAAATTVGLAAAVVAAAAADLVRDARAGQQPLLAALPPAVLPLLLAGPGTYLLARVWGM